VRAKPLRDRIDKATLHKLYWEHKLTSVQIAERYGSFSSNVLILMKKYGIPRRSQGSGKRPR
jgi:hypothetical protein